MARKLGFRASPDGRKIWITDDATGADLVAIDIKGRKTKFTLTVDTDLVRVAMQGWEDAENAGRDPKELIPAICDYFLSLVADSGRSRPPFRFEAAQRSGMKPPTIPN
jgi:hypothetical protein